MKICGIVAEYNPFHNGHAHHIAQARTLSGCGAVVAVMSGNFVQRGEPACVDKWARARMALKCGVDAVFELPVFYALQTADWFAVGGVSILHGLGLDALSFGSELPDIAHLEKLSNAWDEEPAELKAAIQAGMKQGKPHPKARAEALAEWLDAGDAAQALASPNAVLGAMYLRQLRRLNSAMEPVVVQRMGAGYNDESIRGRVASATAVRNALFGGDDWRQAVPEAAAQILYAEMGQGSAPVSTEDFDRLLLYALRTAPSLPDTAEGLDNRMRKAALACGGVHEYYAAVKCKRYTMARIKRAAMQALLGITAQDITLIRAEKPIYARLLGYSRRAEGLVGELAARASIPLITKPSDFKPSGSTQERLWQLDLQASDIYALASKNPALRRGGRDYTERMIVVE